MDIKAHTQPANELHELRGRVRKLRQRIIANCDENFDDIDTQLGHSLQLELSACITKINDITLSVDILGDMYLNSYA